MGILRGIGYAFGILMIIGGIITLPVGLVLIIPAIIIMWVLKKGWRGSVYQKGYESGKRDRRDERTSQTGSRETGRSKVQAAVKGVALSKMTEYVERVQRRKKATFSVF